MKKKITVICLTVITITEVAIHGTMASALLWIGYGIYKL